MGNLRHRSSRRVSYAACVSVAAVLLAATSGALAAKQKPRAYSGALLAPSTLTGVDIKNRTLTSSDLSFGRIGAIGAEGPRGPVGEVGEPGPDGYKGDQGEQGADAARQFSYSYRDTAGRFSMTVNPNFAPSQSWWLRNSISSYTSPNFLTSSGLTMTDLGQAQDSGGVLNLSRTSDVTVNATITLLHRGDPRCADGSAARQMDDPSAACGGYSGPALTPSEADDVNTMSRAECWAVYADANGSSALRIGVSVYVTGSWTDQLVNVPITAGTTLPPGSYTFRTICRLADRTSNAQLDDWEFVHANMSVLAAADSLGS
ncbi:MAG: hypothetical protein JWN72_2192 [Thermoleophilia bacterium]|nr:hypothetical protein [Thermoleophilia bacterium]